MTWKPREEYKTLVDQHKVILTRCTNGDTGPMLVIWCNDHFLVCPGVPIFYGSNQCGWMKHDYFDEWMDIPE